MGLITQIGADASVYNKVMGGLGATANKASNEVSSNLAKASAAGAKFGGSITKGTNEAAMALTNLGRVAQDAPFGFIGIQNNLNPLLESFQRLKADTGSTGGAIKALTGSLMGAGGLGLALSVVTSAITFYTMWQQKAHKGQKDLTDATKDYVSTLDSVRQAQLKGQQNGEQETTRLRILYMATQNHALSLKDRNAAYDELEKKYPKWFSNAEREKTLLGENAVGYGKLALAILATANAKAFEQQIGENSNRDFENQQKINDLYVKRREIQAVLTREQAKRANNLQGNQGIQFSQSSEESAAAKELIKNLADVQNLYADQIKLRDANGKLLQMATAAEQQAGFKTGTELDDKNGKIKEQKNAYELLTAQIKKLETEIGSAAIDGNKGLVGQLGLQLDAALEKLAKLNEIIRISQLAGDGSQIEQSKITFGNSDIGNGENILGKTNNKLTDRGDGGMSDLQKRNTEVKKAQDAQDAYNQSLKTEAMIIGDIAQAAGTGLTSAFESILTGTQSLVSAMGQFLGQLITKLLAAAAAAAVLAVIINVAGFGSGIAAGAAVAGSFKNLFSTFSGVKLAEGGITNGPTRALIGEGREREAVMPLSKLQSFVNTNGGGFKDGQIVGVLHGDKLLLQYQRAAIKKGRVG